MISRRPALVGIVPAIERAVLSATMAATGGHGCKSGASLLAQGLDYQAEELKLMITCCAGSTGQTLLPPSENSGR
jgi:hypothetical protein